MLQYVEIVHYRDETILVYVRTGDIKVRNKLFGSLKQAKEWINRMIKADESVPF